MHRYYLSAKLMTEAVTGPDVPPQTYPLGDAPAPKPKVKEVGPRGKSSKSQASVQRKLARKERHWVNVLHGSVMASGCPSKLSQFVADFNVTHIVTLLKEEERNATALGSACMGLGVGWTHLPLSGADLSFDKDWASLARLPEVVSLLRERQRVVVHCSAGMHRTGAVVYILFRLAGLQKDAALDGVRATREVTYEELIKARRGRASLEEFGEAVVQRLESAAYTTSDAAGEMVSSSPAGP